MGIDKLIQSLTDWSHRMQLEKTSHWLMIIGNFGLLIGVALVIVQINQNSGLVREQLDQSRWTDDLNLHLAMMGENPAKAMAVAVENPSALTIEDSRVLDAYFSYWVMAETRKIRMYERGMTIPEPLTYERGGRGFPIVRRFLSNAYFKAKFEEHGAGPALSERMRALMDSLSGSEAREEYERILARIKKPV